MKNTDKPKQAATPADPDSHDSAEFYEAMPATMSRPQTVHDQDMMDADMRKKVATGHFAAWLLLPIAAVLGFLIINGFSRKGSSDSMDTGESKDS